MILVILGTQRQDFKRLLDEIEHSSINEEILVQAVSTDYISKKMNIVPFIPFDEMEKQIRQARIVITHGGTGSIIQALQAGKIVITCARMKKYGEHVDDHQIEIVRAFSDAGYILELSEGESLDEVLHKAAEFRPMKFESNNSHFVNKLKETMIELLEII